MASKDIIIALSARRYVQKGDYFLTANVLDSSFLEFLNSASYSPYQKQSFVRYSPSFAQLDFLGLLGKRDKDKLELYSDNKYSPPVTWLCFTHSDLTTLLNFAKDLKKLLLENNYQILFLDAYQIRPSKSWQNLDCKKLLRDSILDHLIGKFRRK